MATVRQLTRRRRAAIRAELAGRGRRHAAPVSPLRRGPIPLPELAPCAAPGCGLLCRPIEVHPGVAVLGVIVMRRNLRARCAAHAMWMPGAELATVPQPAAESSPATTAATTAHDRVMHPAAVVVALLLLAVVAAAVLRAAHDSREASQRLEAGQ